MSAAAPPALPADARGLWTRQALAVLRLEVRKILLGKRSLPVYLLAALPLLIVGMISLVVLLGLDDGEMASAGTTAVVYAGIYQFILRFVLYFGCVWIFMNLFRGEIIDGSLHYYFLCPVRREVLAAGKYLAGLLAALLVFVGTTVACWLILFSRHGLGEALGHLVGSGGTAGLASYVLITALGCVGYGALFLVIGLFFRNPVIPAVLIWGWEWMNFLLPSALKRISVIHYLQSLKPVKVDEGTLAIVGEPTSVWVSVPGILAVTVLLMLLAGRSIRRMEIAYGAD